MRYLLPAWKRSSGISLRCEACRWNAPSATAGKRHWPGGTLICIRWRCWNVDLDTMNGISLGKQLRQCSPEICLVYVSAYLEFAPEGYTVNAFRYILKRDLDCQLPRCLDAILHEQDHRTPKTLTIRQNRTETELPYDSIYYLESDLRKINVYGDVAHQPLCSYYGKLNELPQALFENGFLRVGRSAVVNMKYIRQISSYMVTLRNGVKLGVSRNGYAEIRSTYLEWKGQFGDD